MPPRKRSSKRASQKSVPPSARRVRGGLTCPDCGFVARHAMGLGRHRSARHGVVSKRKERSSTGGRWLTRHQAAEHAGVHYNTIRQWEQSGLLRTTRRAGVRGSLVSVEDLERVLGERAAFTSGFGGLSTDDAAVAALSKRYDDLIDGLERLLGTARALRAGTDTGEQPQRRRGRPPGSKNSSPGGKRTARGTARATAARTTAARKKPAARAAGARKKQAGRAPVRSRGGRASAPARAGARRGAASRGRARR